MLLTSPPQPGVLHHCRAAGHAFRGLQGVSGSEMGQLLWAQALCSPPQQPSSEREHFAHGEGGSKGTLWGRPHVFSERAPLSQTNKFSLSGHNPDPPPLAWSGQERAKPRGQPPLHGAEPPTSEGRDATNTSCWASEVAGGKVKATCRSHQGIWLVEVGRRW